MTNDDLTLSPTFALDALAYTVKNNKMNKPLEGALFHSYGVKKNFSPPLTIRPAELIWYAALLGKKSCPCPTAPLTFPPVLREPIQLTRDATLLLKGVGFATHLSYFFSLPELGHRTVNQGRELCDKMNLYCQTTKNLLHV